MTSTVAIPPRWVRKDRRIYDFSRCLACGTGAENGGNTNRYCHVTTCLACGTEQCMMNGFGRGTCGICFIGILPGWSGSRRTCGYAKCNNPAVAVAPRVKNVCADHLARAKVDQGIARALTERSKHWVMVP